MQIPVHNNTLIVFVKQPRLGAVKTRLGLTIGCAAARNVYRTLMNQTIHRLASDRRWRMVLAVTPDRAIWHGWPKSIPRIDQGSGDLGERMSRCLRQLARPRVILIGSDIPGITPQLIARAFHSLKSRHFVFGPAEDGGYWLIGWRRSRWPDGALQAIRWSSDHALEDSLASLGECSQTKMLEVLYDVDTPSEYLRWQDAQIRGS